MAKIKFGDNPPMGSIFASETSFEINAKGSKAVYGDSDSGAKLILFGEDLKESSAGHGQFSAGTVDKLVFRTGDGDDLITVTGGDYKAKALGQGFAADGVWGLYDKLFGGDDRIEGGKANEPLSGRAGDDTLLGGLGEDTLWGGKGDDVLVGGKDSDEFWFQTDDGVGHDRITDFDITGNDADILSLAWEIETIGKTDGGKDTLLTFENGSTLELDGVKRADFVDYWNTPNGTD